MPRPILILLALLSAALAACSRPPTPPGAPPAGPRVVALGPALTIMLRDLNAEHTLVARHAFDTRLPSLPAVGDQSGIDYEALLRLKPTHVVLQWGRRDLPQRLIDLARSTPFELRELPLLTLADADAAAEYLESAIASSTGSTPPAPLRISASIDALRADRASLGRVLVLYTTAPPAALGPGSYHHEIVKRLGASPAITEGSPYMTLDAEDVLRLAPDAILLIQPRDRAAPGPNVVTDAAALHKALGPLADLDIPAIKRARVALFTDPDALIPGSNLIPLARDIAAALDAMGPR